MILTDDIITLLRDTQSKSIAAKTLVSEQLEMIYAKGLFNIWVPKMYGGLELNLPDGTELLENIAYVDGAVAWTITLCSGANMFAGYLDETAAKTTFSNVKVCFGGSGRVGGKAVWDGEFFTITGQWQYATGAPHLTHFTLNAVVYDGDEPRLDEQSNHVQLSFFIPKDEVLIHYDWDTFGLECTASHSFSVHAAKVRAENSFQLVPSKRVADLPLFAIPFMSFAELTLLPNYLGMYHRFLDLVEKYFFEKSKDEVWGARYSKARFRQLDSFQTKFEENRAKARELTEKLWIKASNREVVDNKLIECIANESRKIVAEIREAVTLLFPLVGIQGAQRDSELNIVFRNIFTATQHSLLNIPL